MSQLPANMPLGTGGGVDAETNRDADVMSDVLPSAGHRSGLTAVVRQHLNQQFQASGNVDTLVSELRARIAEIDTHTVSADDPEHARLQAERALLVAQVTYVEDDLAVNGVSTDQRDLTNTTDWQDSGISRAVGEPIADTTSSDDRHVKVYDSTTRR